MFLAEGRRHFQKHKVASCGQGFDKSSDMSFKNQPWVPSGMALWTECCPSYVPKGHKFNCQSGHLPRLQAKCPWWVNVSLSY